MELNFCTQCGRSLMQSYYFAPKNLIMVGFIAYVKAREFGKSNEVDSLMWVDLNKALTMVERENNYSGVHLDRCVSILNGVDIQ